MASKARVGLSAAKPTITTSSTRIRATYTAGKAVAAVTINRPALAAGRVSAAVDTQVTIPAALLKWVSIVFSVDVDTIGRNPILKNVFAVADSVDVRAEKRLTELLVTSEDTFLLFFKKGNLEPLTTSETKSFAIQKPLSDSVSVTDDFYGQANTDDDETMFFSKAVPAEFNTVSDRTVVSAGKGLVEAMHAADQIGPFFIGKAASDGIHLTEVRSVSFSKQLADGVHAGDEFNAVAVTDDGEVMVFGKTLADAIVSGDSAAVEAGKGLPESVSSSDELLPFILGKGITDSALTSEQLLRDISKPLSDEAVKSDAAAVAISKAPFVEFRYATDGPAADITYAVYGYFGEDYVYEYFPAKDFFKGRSESLTTLDSVNIATAFNRSFTDAFASSDVGRIFISKPRADSASTSDAAVQVFGKARSDSASTSESQARDFSKYLSDLVDATDDFQGVANIDDDQLMTFAKLTSDYATTSEFVRASVSKAVADAVSKSDVRVFDFGKAVSDSVTKSDAATKSNAKAASDSFATSDAKTYLIGKGLSESQTTTESRVVAISKPLADTFTKSDAAAKSFDKPASDSITKSDSTIKTAGKAASDSAVTSETKTFAVSKSLSDIVTTTDDFYGVANTDDDQTMLYGKVSSEVVSKSDATAITAGKALTDSVSKSDSGSLVWTDYWDVTYTNASSEVYVGNSRTF